MPTRTITLELDAYERLRRAKREPREPFSSVVRRARWDDLQPTARELLEGLRRLVQETPEALLSPEALDSLDHRRRTVRRRSRRGG